MGKRKFHSAFKRKSAREGEKKQKKVRRENALWGREEKKKEKSICLSREERGRKKQRSWEKDQGGNKAGWYYVMVQFGGGNGRIGKGGEFKFNGGGGGKARQDTNGNGGNPRRHKNKPGIPANGGGEKNAKRDFDLLKKKL